MHYSDKYKDLLERVKYLVKEQNKLILLAKKVGTMEVGNAYQKANARLHYDSTQIRRMEKSLDEFYENVIKGHDAEQYYYPSSFHQQK